MSNQEYHLQVKYINKVCTRVYDCICSKRNNNPRKQNKETGLHQIWVMYKIENGNTEKISYILTWWKTDPIFKEFIIQQQK